MRRIIYILVLICLTNLVKGQVYQSMPQYGYGPVKRMDFDSSLTIPTTCGVPTLRTYLTKKAAIAYDSCNKRLYYYDPKLMAWDTIKGGGSGTTIDTSGKFINRIEQVNGWDSIRYYIGDTFYHVRTGMDTSRVLIAKVHNAEAITLTRGTAVYLSGATGDVAAVRRANNKHDSTSARTLGLVREDIAAGQIGYVITKGQITKLNLGAFNAGDFIYLDSIDGQFTKNKPKAPFHYVQLGIVERANAGNGLAYLNPMNGFETDEIHDIQINNITNNQILVYSDTQGVWKNRSVYSVVDTTSLSNRINARQAALTGYDETNDRLGLKQATPTASLHINSNKNTATQSDTAGILLANSTAAINNTQSVSPPIVWQGNGWKTTATAASQDVRFRAYALPVQGTTNPTGQWIVESSVNGASYEQLFSLTTGSGASIGPINYSAGKINISSYNIKTAAPTENVMTLSSTETGSGGTYPTQLNFLQKGATTGWTIQSVNQGVGYTPLILNELGGNVLIGTTTNQGARLNVNGTIRGSQFLLSALNTAPATASSTGTTGEIRIVNGFIYVCVATNTWQRAALSTW